MSGVQRYTVDAKAEDPTKATEEQLLQMLQGLLIERFKLKFHREIKHMPGYTLVVAKNGPKLLKAKGEDVESTLGRQRKTKGRPAGMSDGSQVAGIESRRYPNADGEGPRDRQDRLDR